MDSIVTIAIQLLYHGIHYNNRSFTQITTEQAVVYHTIFNVNSYQLYIAITRRISELLIKQAFKHSLEVRIRLSK